LIVRYILDNFLWFSFKNLKVISWPLLMIEKI
jgi:hypothetical protein